MLLEEHYVEFLIEHKLTQEQFLLLYLIYKGRKDLIIKYKNTFPTSDNTMIGKYWIDDLIKKGFIEFKDTTNNAIPTVSLKFREIFCNPIDVAEELLKVYPNTMEIDNKIVPLTAVDIVWVAKEYSNAIKGSQQEHLEVIKDIDFAIKTNALSLGLKAFINSRYWIGIRKKRLVTNTDDLQSKQNQTFG